MRQKKRNNVECKRCKHRNDGNGKCKSINKNLPACFDLVCDNPNIAIYLQCSTSLVVVVVVCCGRFLIAHTDFKSTINTRTQSHQR